MRTHPEDPKVERRLLAIAAARLRGDGLTQQQIAEQLGRKQPEVSRLLSHADDEGFLARWPRFLSQEVGADELAEVERRFFVPENLRAALRKLAGKGMHLDVRVLPEWEEPFAVAAASRVVELLRRAKLVGVMWGRRVERLATFIARRREMFDRPGLGDAQCIPLCGDPVHLMNLGRVKYSASHLAAELGQAINPGRPSDQPCLAGVPAYLPRKFFLGRREDELDLESFVQGIPGHRSIFGPGNHKEKPWIERVDTIISGMGIIVPPQQLRDRKAAGPELAAHEETGDFIRERLIQEVGLAESALARMVYGDIGGWLLERKGLETAQHRLVQSLNQGWTGSTVDHLAAVARNAHPKGAPGVIVLAAGPARAEMTREIVRRRLANELLIDTTLAEALLKLCGAAGV